MIGTPGNHCISGFEELRSNCAKAGISPAVLDVAIAAAFCDPIVHCISQFSLNMAAAGYLSRDRCELLGAVCRTFYNLYRFFHLFL
jgi:hypothetical protein